MSFAFLFLSSFDVLYSVGHSHQLKMSVSKVSQNQYDRLNNDLSEIHKAGEISKLKSILG